MFGTNPEEVALDFAISEAFNTLKRLTEDSPEYAAATDQVIKLIKLKKEINPSWRPSPDALLAFAGTIVTAVIVLNFEKFGVITTKAFGFIGKMMK